MNYAKIREVIESNLNVLNNIPTRLKLKDKIVINGFFDLKQIEGLRAYGFGKAFREYRKKNCLTQADIANIIKTTQTTVSTFEKDKYGIPIKTLVEIFEKVYHINNYDTYNILRDKQVKFGKECSKYIVSLPFAKEEISEAALHFLIPMNNGGVLIDARASPSIISKIENLFKIKSSKLPEKENRIIHSKTVCDFLSTFYSISKHKWQTVLYSETNNNQLLNTTKNKYLPTFEEYLSSAPSKTEVYLLDLPPFVCVRLSNSNIKTITLKNLLKKGQLENYKSIINWSGKRYNLPIIFPVCLNNKYYVIIYAIMASEGYYGGKEFSLHVPEKEFHSALMNSLKKLFKCNIPFVQSISNGVPKTRVSGIIRHILPIPEIIPQIILINKNFAKIYLKFAFEAEGSAILNKSKRYIKLSRNVDITPLLQDKIDYPIGKRIYFRQFNKDFPDLSKQIIKVIPPLLVGEHLLLKHHFNIDNKIVLEAIRINFTSSRCGKITAKWVLYIYANNIDKFIKEIGFVTKRKQEKTKRMSKIRGQHEQFSTFEIINKIQNKGIFIRADFIGEMKKLGYVTPQAFLWRYSKKGVISRIDHGIYKINQFP